MAVVMTRKRKFIIAMAAVVVLAIILVAALVVPKFFSNKNTASNVRDSQQYSSTMPNNAAADGGEWLVKLLKHYDGVLKDGMFEDSSKDSTILDKMRDKDYSQIPNTIRDSFYWTEDSKSESKAVDNDQLLASGYLATMTAWQLRTDALSKDRNMGVDSSLIYVDRTHGTIQIPAEAYCGFPADMVIQLVWTGKEWKIDGSGTAVPILAKLRSEQIKQMLTNNNGNGTTNENSK